MVKELHNLLGVLDQDRLVFGKADSATFAAPFNARSQSPSRTGWGVGRSAGAFTNLLNLRIASSLERYISIVYLKLKLDLMAQSLTIMN
jgi:hypothetical protein